MDELWIKPNQFKCTLSLWAAFACVNATLVPVCGCLFLSSFTLVVHGRADGGPLIVSSFQPCVLVGFLDKCLYFILCSGLWDVSDREEEAAPIS